MDKSQLKAVSQNELPFLLEKASLFGGRLTQATLNSKIISDIRNLKINSDGTMTVGLFDEIPLESDRYISFNLNYRNIHFHIDSRSFSQEGKNLIAELPREAKAIVKRFNERYALPLGSKVPVDIYRIEKRGASGDLIPHIVDVSEFGLGLILPYAENDSILTNDHIWIKAIDQIELEKPIFGRVVYVNKRRYKDEVIDCKLGISLQSSLPQEIFLKLQEMCKLILTA